MFKFTIKGELIDHPSLIAISELNEGLAAKAMEQVVKEELEERFPILAIEEVKVVYESEGKHE